MLPSLHILQLICKSSLIYAITFNPSASDLESSEHDTCVRGHATTLLERLGCAVHLRRGLRLYSRLSCVQCVKSEKSRYLYCIDFSRPSPESKSGGRILREFTKITNRVRMNIPSPSPAVLREPRGVDGNIHTNWLALYGGCPGHSIGFSLRYQGELLGLWDPQNRDLRRKLPPETKFSFG